MFRCEKCLTVVPPHVPVERITVETRRREYAPRPKANRLVRGGREKWTDDPGGVGLETARELRVCPDCARKLKSAR